HEVARALGVRFLFTERDSDRRMSLRRGFTLSPGERAIVIEDVITTGGSTREVIEIVKAAGAEAIAAGSIIDRSGGAADLGIPRVALETVDVPVFEPERCPSCASGEPITKPGARPSRNYRSEFTCGDLTRRIRITIAYDGTDFHGWQVQPGLPTIQGTLEEIIGGMEGRPVHVAGSGRTDAGVHARAQVAAFTIENPIPPSNLQRAVNRLLPPAIRILDAAETHADFHPRFDAIAKVYQYTLYRGPVCSPFEWRYVHHHPYPLDEGTMIEAARLFEGEHDFTAFAASDARS